MPRPIYFCVVEIRIYLHTYPHCPVGSAKGSAFTPYVIFHSGGRTRISMASIQVLCYVRVLCRSKYFNATSDGIPAWQLGMPIRDNHYATDKSCLKTTYNLWHSKPRFWPESCHLQQIPRGCARICGSISQGWLYWNRPLLDAALL